MSDEAEGLKQMIDSLFFDIIWNQNLCEKEKAEAFSYIKKYTDSYFTYYTDLAKFIDEVERKNKK